MSSFTPTVLFSRLCFSLAIIICYRYPILFYIGLIYKENKNNDLILLLLSVYFILTILVLMILGWALNCKSNIWIKTVVIIGSCCAIPHLLLSLVFFSRYFMHPFTNIYLLPSLLVFERWCKLPAHNKAKEN